jgi:16S rRNA (uracil1498-N3)-methyltransferase
MKAPPLRALPRVFVPGASPDGPIVLPKDETEKLRKVLRLVAGDHVAVLPDDGTLIRCEWRGHDAHPLEVVKPKTEPSIRVTLLQALPKGDKLDEIVRVCTEIGVSRFVLFPSERSVVRWDEEKAASRVARLRTIAREAAEVSFRTRLPEIQMARGLPEVLNEFPGAFVLSEAEDVTRYLPAPSIDTEVVVGPEGGWSPRELEAIGGRGVTLGPRVLRVDHAGAAAAAILLLRPGV